MNCDSVVQSHFVNLLQVYCTHRVSLYASVESRMIQKTTFWQRL